MDSRANMTSFDQKEINWDKLDKTKLFVVGAGLFTGVTVALYPVSVIKTRIQVASKDTQKNALAVFKNIVKVDGIPGLYRGFGTVITGAVPARIIFLTSLETTKVAAIKMLEPFKLSEPVQAAVANGFGGMVASVSAQAVFVPIDVVSQKLMVQGYSGHANYNGGLDVAQKIIKADGFRGLYRGFGLSVMTYSPSSAVWWASYGSSQRVIWRMNTSQKEMNGTLKNKRKKFWSLEPEWITGLLQIMMEYVNANMRSAQGFKDSMYQGAAKKMKEKFGIEVTGEQCKNQIRHQRSIWNHIQELKRKSGVSWDETNKIIMMGQEEYASHIQVFPKDAAYINITIANYVELEVVCGLGHATGEWAKSGNSQTPLGTQHIHVDDDEPSQFTDEGADRSMPAEMQALDDSTKTIKKSVPSSGKGGVKRKSKASGIDQEIRECINLMADSVTDIASAIKSSTKSPKQIRDMYNDLILELTNIPGFSEEEVYTIYDNLSKNPTLIPSFLSKPTDWKVSWMRKELGN